MNWLDKYRPSQLCDVICDEIETNKLIFFIKQFKNKNSDNITNPCILISGPNGVGKSLITDIVLESNNFDKIIADFSNVSVTKKSKKKKLTDKEIMNANRSVSIYYKSLANSKEMARTGLVDKKNIALVINDVSNVSNPKEKEAIKAIVKINNRLKEIPIIVITGTKHTKTVSELRKIIAYPAKISSNGSKTSKKTNVPRKKQKKITNEVALAKPDYSKMEKLINKICSNEKIKLPKNKSQQINLFESIIDHSQNDIRRMINILEDIKSFFEDSVVTDVLFEQFCETSKMKDIDPGIYEAARILLNNYQNIDEAQQLYSEDRSSIPLMVHENYPDNIRYQYPKLPHTDQINLIYEISKSISESDKIDGIIYSNQCWNLQTVHGFYSCVLPSYIANKTKNKMHKTEKYKYTRDYNRTSIKKINNKAIKKAREHNKLKKVSVYDFFCISSVLKSYLENKDIESIVNLMIPYGLKSKEIESVIKINKISENKTVITSRQSSALKELMGEDLIK